MRFRLRSWLVAVFLLAFLSAAARWSFVEYHDYGRSFRSVEIRVPFYRLALYWEPRR